MAEVGEDERNHHGLCKRRETTQKPRRSAVGITVETRTLQGAQQEMRWSLVHGQCPSVFCPLPGKCERGLRQAALEMQQTTARRKLGEHRQVLVDLSVPRVPNQTRQPPEHWTDDSPHASGVHVQCNLSYTQGRLFFFGAGPWIVVALACPGSNSPEGTGADSGRGNT